MQFKNAAVLFALTTSIAAPAPAWAIGGGPGCSDLPEYDRAVGTLQGLSTCDMSVEQARRIVAATQGGSGAPLAHHRHHRVAPPS